MGNAGRYALAYSFIKVSVCYSFETSVSCLEDLLEIYQYKIFTVITETKPECR